MSYLYPFLTLMIIILSPNPTSSMQFASTDCGSSSNQCGDMSIEYPFCGSYNNNFSVTCNTSSSKPKLFLTKFNLEVLDYKRGPADNGGQITVKAPIFQTCGNQSSSIINLTGTPFFFDTTNNVFASIQCDRNPNSQKILDGCSSRYHNDHCCIADVRSISRLKSYSLEGFGIGIGDGGGSCRSVFLTSRVFLLTNITLNMAVTENAVPVVLGWSLGYHGSTDDGYYTGLVSVIILIFLLPTVGGIFILSSCCFWWGWLYKTRKRRKEIKLRAKYFKKRLKEQNSPDMELLQNTKLFSMKEMNKATNGYGADRILGQGGQGIVYKGILTDGEVVAIKKSREFGESDWKEFINEVILLSQVTHRNVVKLFGCCLETKAPLLVYEFVPNGTLSHHIHDVVKGGCISWEVRVRIAYEAAGAIAYLHSSSSTPIYHRDVKSTNILLDEDYHAKVSDFGISKAVGLDQTHLTTRVQGTFGYLDPEYFESSQFSEKSDVYSFGVILVELLTGQRPIRETTVDEEISLVDYFLSSSINESSLEVILDRVVLEGGTKEDIWVVATLAQKCLNSRGIERPTMDEVVMELEGLRKKSPSKSITKRQISLEIENAATASAPVAHNSYSRSSYDDESPLFSGTW